MQKDCTVVRSLCFSFKRRTVTICISHQHEPQVHRPHLSKSCWFVHRKCTQLPLSVAILRPCSRYHHCNKTTYICIIPNKRNYIRPPYKAHKRIYPRFISRYVFMRIHKIGSRGMKGHMNPEFCKNKEKWKNY